MERSYLYFLIIICLLSGCTVQKRIYTKGYHIDWLIFEGKNKKVITEDKSITNLRELPQKLASSTFSKMFIDSVFIKHPKKVRANSEKVSEIYSVKQIPINNEIENPNNTELPTSTIVNNNKDSSSDKDSKPNMAPALIILGVGIILIVLGALIPNLGLVALGILIGFIGLWITVFTLIARM